MIKLVYRFAIRNGEVGVDPTGGLELPARNGSRDAVVGEEVAARLIEAAPEWDRPIWATAFYAGLRLGEIQALEWKDVAGPDAQGIYWINVERSHDQVARITSTPKTPAGVRRVPVLEVLEPYLEQQWRARQAAGGGPGLVFFRTVSRDATRTCLRVDSEGKRCPRKRKARGLCQIHYHQWNNTGRNLDELPAGRDQRTAHLDVAFYSDFVQKRADKAWKAAGLERVTLHVCRHTLISILFSRGVNPTLIQKWAGHAKLSTTLDVYTHMIPGSDTQAVALANAEAPKPVIASRPPRALGPGSSDE